MKCAATLVWLQVKTGQGSTGTAASVCRNGPSGTEPVNQTGQSSTRDGESSLWDIWKTKPKSDVGRAYSDHLVPKYLTAVKCKILTVIPWKFPGSYQKVQGKKKKQCGRPLYFPVKTAFQASDKAAA